VSASNIIVDCSDFYPLKLAVLFVNKFCNFKSYGFFKQLFFKLRWQQFLLINFVGLEIFGKDYGPYYKRKLELKSNSSESLSVNCKFICDSTST